MIMREERREGFFEEKLRIVKETLQQLKEDKRIRGFLGPFSFAERTGGYFYVTYVSDVKYIGRSLSVAKNHGEENKNSKATIRVSLFESKDSLRRKILETIKRL